MTFVHLFAGFYGALSAKGLGKTDGTVYLYGTASRLKALSTA